jgi:hypothetical protein
LFKVEAQGTETKCPKILRAAGNYIKEHPASFTLQAVGILSMTASVVAVPVLGQLGLQQRALWLALLLLLGNLQSGWSRLEAYLLGVRVRRWAERP